jgi:cytidyltransferase-like protein
VKKVFVSGCYDALHGGHLEFFRQAKALGDHLTVCVPSDDVLLMYKKRLPWIPLDHKRSILSALEPVDEVIVGSDLDPALNFRSEFLRIKPAILAVTQDDKFGVVKRALCAEVGASYVSLPKSLGYQPISTTEIRNRVSAVTEAPLRVDFAGGWLDVPRFSREGAYIVNCSITPKVSLSNWPYEQRSGVGGSGAWAFLQGRDAVSAELGNLVGWQDPAVIMETGLCVWRSGSKPILDLKVNPDFLQGKMALFWTGVQHETRELANMKRDYDLLVEGAAIGRRAVLSQDLNLLAEAVNLTHEVQLKEGMDPLPSFGEMAKKYCGSGHGGYAVYLFDRKRPEGTDWMAIEPYLGQFPS